ncbi:hypothetical protein CAPTEDRAFT_227020 [Capitella teleta]|uniref:C-type lectin domain-containing protein n=1 Tax=Capitella teleta TaxID=283909 RepID=R7VCW8_CAPTE|nr:hypothetical protein CAPTEDRAFT_227020 [Capitella teleta]|eukprot:ELU13525.1 hypothetical protein CAPTEDRAFT_227020 [Capitella teleta]
MGTSERLALGKRINESKQQNTEIPVTKTPATHPTTQQPQPDVYSDISALEEKLDKTERRFSEYVYKTERQIKELMSALNSTQTRLERLMLKGAEKCWKRANSDQISCYTFSTRPPLQWNRAKEVCSQDGGHLLATETDEEYDAVAHFLRGKPEYHTRWWTGANDLAIEGLWIWDSVAPQMDTFNRWAKNRPNGGSDENCGDIWDITLTVSCVSMNCNFLL